MQVQLRLHPDHVDYHKDHLLFLMWQLLAFKARQIKLTVNCEHIFVSRQSVHSVKVSEVGSMLVIFHAGSATAHLN